MSFSYLDYYKMYKAKGWYLPYKYFFENHFFDLKRQVDTHSTVQKNEFEEIENLNHGVHYACSWESTIKKSFNEVSLILKNRIEHFSFLDIGCGKGKVPIVWKEISQKEKLKLDIYGIDYSKKLIQIAENNFLSLFKKKGNFICVDITKLNFNEFSKKKFVIYLYNPFNEIVFLKLLDLLENFPVCIIYVHPIYDNVLKSKNFNLKYQFTGKHPTETFSIYLK